MVGLSSAAHQLIMRCLLVRQLRRSPSGRTLARPPSCSSTFCGLRSRCTTTGLSAASVWRYTIALATSAAMTNASRSGSGAGAEWCRPRRPLLAPADELPAGGLVPLQLPPRARAEEDAGEEEGEVGGGAGRTAARAASAAPPLLLREGP